MQKDPRSRNQYFNTESISTYLGEYAAAINAALRTVDGIHLKGALNLISKTRESGGRIFVAGNGGSASISDHLCCDFQKGTHMPGQKGIDVRSLAGSTSLLTALANDFNYESVFSEQLRMNNLEEKDLVILISSSGNSPNIIAAANTALQCSSWVIGLTGFQGGELRALTEKFGVSLHIPVENYGVVEDCHQALMHVLAQYHTIEGYDGP